MFTEGVFGRDRIVKTNVRQVIPNWAASGWNLQAINKGGIFGLLHEETMSALLTRLACLIRAEKHEERSDRLVFAINETFLGKN